MLGWYEMAAFVAIRSKCCSSAPPLELPSGPDNCEPVANARNAIEKGVRSGADEAAMDSLIGDYTNTIYCLLKVGAARTFGRHPTPRGGEVTTLKKTLARTR